MRLKNYLTTSLLVILSIVFCYGQDGSVDFMRSIGKIYVVVAVVLAIFIGIVLFLIFLDRRLTKIEHQIKRNE